MPARLSPLWGRPDAMHRWCRERALKRLRAPEFAALFADPPAGEAVCIDCEATSLNLHEAELLSIAAIRIHGSQLDLGGALRLLVQPRGPIPAASIRVHGLRALDVAEGMDAESAVRALLRFVGPRPLVGYYLEYDLGLIERASQPWLGVRLPNRRIEVSGLYHDARIGLIPQRRPDLRLASILADLNLPRLPTHDAFHDALAAGLIYLRLTSATDAP